MDYLALCATLQAATSAHLEERRAAEQQLAQLQGGPGFLWALLQVVARNDVDVPIRQMASIHFKNLVSRHWRPISPDAAGATPAGPTFSDDDKATVKQHLVEALVHSPPQIRKQLIECIKSVVRHDYPDNWPALMPLVISSIQSSDQARIYSGLIALRVITRKYEFKDDENNEPLKQAVQTTFPQLLVILKQLLALPPTALESAEYVKLILKIFWSSSYLKVPELLHQEPVFLEWMECFHSLLQRPVPEEGQPLDPEQRKNWPWWKVKKWLLHIINRLFNRFADPSRAKGTDKAFATMFQEKVAVSFMEANVALLSQLRGGVVIPDRIINLSLQYLTYCIARKHTYEKLKPHVPMLLSDVTFPLMCFGDNDQQLWLNDPHEYIRKGYDIIEDMYSARTAAMNFVAELLTKKSKEHLDSYMGNIVAILTRYSSIPDGQKPYREKDGALLVVGSMHEKLKSTERYASQLETMLVQHVLPEFASPAGHLRAKAAWVAGQYADIEFTNQENFNAAFHSILGLLKDPELPVRVDAVVALRSYIEEAEDLSLLRPLVPQLLDDFFRIMNEVGNEDLIFTLEVLVEKLGEEMAPYAIGLVTNLAANFWKNYRQSEEAQAADEEDDGDEGAMRAAGCLRAISTILESVSTLPQLYPQMEPCLLPILVKMISTDGQDVIEEVLAMAAYMTFYTPTISPELWQIWPLMVAALDDFAIDYFEEMVSPFDNFISRSTDHFLTCPQPNYPESLFKLVSSVLSNEALSDMDVTAAPKLMESVLQNCKGRVDQWIEPYLSLVIQRLPKTDSRHLKDLLLMVVADCLYYNPALTLAVLQKLNATSALFQTWLAMIHATKGNKKPAHFKREQDKKVCILGLVALLSLPPTALPAEVVAGQQQLVQGVLKLLVAYKQQQAANALEEDEDDDEEDGEDETEEDDDTWEDADGEEGESSSGNKKLKDFARMANKMIGEEDEDDDDDDDDYFTEDDDDCISPIDEVDPFIFFSDTMAAVQAADAARFQALVGGLDFAHQAMAHDVAKQADERRKQLAEEQAEKAAKQAQQQQ